MKSSPTVALGTSQFTIHDYAQARNRYKPDEVKILFVAESPPSSGGYFYFSETIGKDHLFREMMKALGLWSRSQRMERGIDKRPLLEKFRSKGFFLIDTCELPVDKLPKRERRSAINQGATTLESRVRRLDPSHIAVVKTTVFRPVFEALERAGLGGRVLNKSALPFPNHGHQRRFRNGVRRFVKEASSV